MLGISYGELFLIIGATAALVGPKDLPIIARTAGRLAGRAIGYVQLARGQFDSILQQSQARQVHKELQDTMAQLEAIRHEVRTISFINPGPLTRRLVDNIDHAGPANGYNVPPEAEKVNTPSMTNSKDYSSTTPSSSTMHSHAAAYERLGEPATFNSANVHSRATAYERLAESAAFNSGVSESNEVINELTDESGLLVLPVSAESTGLLPNRRDDTKGSDIVLEAVMEAEVARNAKEFFTQPAPKSDEV